MTSMIANVIYHASCGLETALSVSFLGGEVLGNRDEGLFRLR
jgi:hypothetical protein